MDGYCHRPEITTLTENLSLSEKKPERRHMSIFNNQFWEKNYRDLEFGQITRMYNLKENFHHE